jgi:hypothetical protein
MHAGHMLFYTATVSGNDGPDTERIPVPPYFYSNKERCGEILPVSGELRIARDYQVEAPVR